MFDLKMGFTCNNNCVHCVVGAKRWAKDFTTDEIKAIIDKDAVGDDGIVFTGGEPTIRKDFVELVKYANAHGHWVHIQTNGTGFADEDMVEELEGCDIQVLLAIHSCKREVHNKIVRTKSDTRDMYSLTMQGFHNLIKHHIPMETQTVLSSWSIPTLYATYKFIQEEAPGVLMHLTYPHCMGEAKKNHDIVAVRYSDFKDILQRCLRDFHEYLLVEAVPFCYLFPWQDKMNYNFDANILTGGTWRHGIDKANANTSLTNDEGLMPDYNLADIMSKRKAPLCKDCVFDSVCPGVWKEYIEYFHDRLDLFPITKEEFERCSDSQTL